MGIIDGLALLLIHSFAAASPAVPLPFHLTAQGGIIVPAIVNGIGPVSFMLDTGSNGSVISEPLALALGAKAVAKTTLMSASGRRDALVVRIEHLAVGGVSTQDLQMTVVSPDAFNLPDLAASGRNIQGVIGQDVLGALRYTIDYAQRRIVWHDAAARIPAHATVLELESQDDRLVARVPQDHHVLRLVPDTGAETLVLFQHGGSIPPTVSLANEPVELTGLTGTRNARRVVVRAFRVGSTLLTDVPAVMVKSECDATALDGLLPLHLFARVTFNGPEHQLLIETH
jgi:predicted aspartyl protease